MRTLVSVTLLLLVFTRTCWCLYDLISVLPGTRMAVNDDLYVSASNAFANFAVVIHPFRPASVGGPVHCNMRYNDSDRFVHSVAVLGIAKNSTNAEEFLFVFTAEKMSTGIPYVCISRVIKSTCVATAVCTDMTSTRSPQEYFLIGVNRNGTFAYGFTSTFVFKMDIYANQIVLNFSMGAIWPVLGFIPHALDVASTWAVVAGYGYTDAYRQNYAALGCLVDLSRLMNTSCVPVTAEASFLIPLNVLSYNELYELSVAIRGDKVLVGVHRLASAVVLRRRGSVLNVTSMYSLSSLPSSSVGRVVDWADDTTIAILVDDPFETAWSRSQIFFYQDTSKTMTSPIFTFPNNQQVLGSRLSRPSFARFSITPTGNMGILTDNADVLIIPVAPAGQASSWINTTQRSFLFYFESKPCIGGTYKNRSGLGPCPICPPRTQNPGTSLEGVIQCLPCANNTSTSFCPLASLVDVNLTSLATYSQAVAYPETTATTDIEDLLIQNVFHIGTDRHCLLISPFLWTLVVGSICLLFLAFVLVISLLDHKPGMACVKQMKIFFRHTDIIGEGKLWLGGLATMAILVLVIFAYWFSASFIRRYPIEDLFEPATFACDQSVINAQFSTGLELLAIPKSDDAQPVFDLLDNQGFNLTIELVNTGFPCNSTTVQENLISSKYVPLPVQCQRVLENATTIVTFTLPRHWTTVQVNISGPFWIGAVRLCVRGRGETNRSYTLRELDFCKLYMSANQALGRSTFIPIAFLKNINMTQALDPANPTQYSGMWMPTFSTVSFSDEDYYAEFGDYLRYIDSTTILGITLDERPFYIKNIQRPIVRTAELIFHDLLFTSLCIELFAFSFLFAKLCIVPLCRWVIRTKYRLCHRIASSNNSCTISSNDRARVWRTDVDSTDLIDSNSSCNSRVQRSDQHRSSISETDCDSIQTITKL